MSNGPEALPRLQQLLARDDLTIEELTDVTHRLLATVAPEQTRYKVTERPDVRTVRYYTSRGLLPKPCSYDGGRARYSGEHVARLLLIKRLQAEQNPLRKIARLLEGASLADVLRHLAVADEEDASCPAPPRPMSAVDTVRICRFALPGGGSVDLPEGRLSDDRERRTVADQLRAIANELTMPHSEEKS